MPEEKKKYPVGWECPRCGSINSPDTEKCQCIKIESAIKSTKQLLTE